MTREVVSLAGDAPLGMAAWRLASEAVSGAPVRDARGNIIGVLSRTDLVEFDCGLGGGLAREDAGPGVPEADRAQASAGVSKRVKDIMTPGVWAVHPDAPALEAVELMVEKCIHRVLVVRGPGQLEGIVTAMDVMRAIAGGDRFHPGGEAWQTRSRDQDGGEEDEQAAEDEKSRAAAGASR